MGSGDLSVDLFSFVGSFLDSLLAELDVELLVFNLLADRLVLAVVADVVLLLLVLLDQSLGFLDSDLVVGNFRGQTFGFFLKIADTGFQTGHLVLEILDLQGQLTAIGADLVDLRINLLQGI